MPPPKGSSIRFFSFFYKTFVLSVVLHILHLTTLWTFPVERKKRKEKKRRNEIYTQYCRKLWIFGETHLPFLPSSHSPNRTTPFTTPLRPRPPQATPSRSLSRYNAPWLPTRHPSPTTTRRWQQLTHNDQQQQINPPCKEKGCRRPYLKPRVQQETRCYKFSLSLARECHWRKKKWVWMK